MAKDSTTLEPKPQSDPDEYKWTMARFKTLVPTSLHVWDNGVLHYMDYRQTLTRPKAETITENAEKKAGSRSSLKCDTEPFTEKAPGIRG